MLLLSLLGYAMKAARAQEERTNLERDGLQHVDGKSARAPSSKRIRALLRLLSAFFS